MKSSKNFLSFEWSSIILAEFISNWQLFEVYYFRPIPIEIYPSSKGKGGKWVAHLHDFVQI